MPSLTRVQLIGSFWKVREAAPHPMDKKVSHFCLAFIERWKSLKGKNKEATEWVNVEA
jgi:hypothetical protein